jgi:hypothetical protein
LADIADLRAAQITCGQHGAERLHKSLTLKSSLFLFNVSTLLVMMGSYLQLALSKRLEAAQKVRIESRLMGLSSGVGEALPLLEFQGDEALEPSLA